MAARPLSSAANRPGRRACASAAARRRNTHQHLTAAPTLSELGAEIAIAKAKAASGVAISDVRYAAVYDSLTITLAMTFGGFGVSCARRGGGARPVRLFQPRRRDAAQYPWRALELRPLRRRRRDGATWSKPIMQIDRAHRQPPGARRLGRAVAWRRRACCRRMSAFPGAIAMSDWTSGEQTIRYQSCVACGRLQYFRRGFCAVCGATEPRRAPRQRRGGGLRKLRWSAAPRRRRAAHICPTTSCWSIPSRAFA